MVEGSRRRLSDREIVELLLKHGSLSLPQIAKLLDANVGSVDYHLKKLAEKGIVKIKKKKYGTKYSLDERIMTASTRTAVQFAITLIFTVIGFVFLLRFEFVHASFLLSISSVVGTFLAFKKLKRELEGKIKEILKEID